MRWSVLHAGAYDGEQASKLPLSPRQRQRRQHVLVRRLAAWLLRLCLALTDSEVSGESLQSAVGWTKRSPCSLTLLRMQSHCAAIDSESNQ